MSSAALSAETPASEARKRYLADRAACASPDAVQDRTTCLKEAAAAQAAAHADTLAGRDKPDRADFTANTEARCQALPPAEATACRARMQGQGTRSGSVGGGGIYRELSVVDPPASASSATAPNRP